MATISETGHAKNVANFEQLWMKCTLFNDSYNPSNSILQLQNLQNIYVQGMECLSSINKANGILTIAVSTRFLALKPLGKLATRICNSVKASGASLQNIEQVKSIILKLQGRRVSAKKSKEEMQAPLTNGKLITEISASQMSFDNRLNNFDKLIKLLSLIPQYIPNESDLTITALSAYYSDLKEKNRAVISHENALYNLRITRDDLLYKDITGMLDVANGVKMYVKSVFNAASPQYRQLSCLKFTKPR